MFRDRRRNMNPLVHNRNQGAVEIVNLTRWTRSEEGEDRLSGRKGDDYRILSFKNCDLRQLAVEGQKDTCLRRRRCQIGRKRLRTAFK